MDDKSTRLSIKDWSQDDRPREKLLAQGSQSLSNAELLAILIGSGTRNMSAVELCRNIYSHAGDSLDKLGKLNLKELMKFKGIGEAKAITIAAAMELGKRRAAEQPTQIIKISSSNDAFQVLRPLIGDLPHEEFWTLLLDNNNKVIGKHQVSKGGFTSTLVDTRVLFKRAIEEGSISMILAHNHPSGKLLPSAQDKEITAKIKEAGATLDIKVLDHLIITVNGFYSFADEGLI